MKKIKNNNRKDFNSEKPENWTWQVWDFLPQTCDICGSQENPADPLLECDYGGAANENDFCDNIICRQCRIEDRANKRIICRWCFSN